MSEVRYWIVVITTLLIVVNLVAIVWRLGRLEKRVERLEHPPQHVKFSEGTHSMGGAMDVTRDAEALMRFYKRKDA